ncbi:MAG: TldD/PmbA family protein [Candidatus Eremiobacteraeota bacterium]|nr:TldD/PmbA family protein [Candidatus Eremiobacteraeota bacterium]
MTRSAREALALKVLDRSSADQTEVLVDYSDSALTRFARGISNQNVAAEDRVVSVRAIIDGRTGVAATNDFDDDALDAVVSRAMETASFVPSDPMQPSLPSGVGVSPAPPHAYFDSTARATPESRASAADAILSQAESAGFWCSGYVSTSVGGVTIANSSGARASFDGTDSAANVKVIAERSTGFAEWYSHDSITIDGAAIGKRAVDKAIASANIRRIEPGDWTVILEPAAFGELLAYLASHFSAQNFSEGSSFFSGKLGERYFGESLTISDDYTDARAPGMPFDYEGAPRSRLALIERGIVQNIVTDSYYARKLGIANTGHALPAPNAGGPQPLNLVVTAGASSVDDLIAQTDRGLLITRFWYIRTVDQKRAIVTGMTRDGTFLIEDGKIVSGVRNMRFNQSIVDSLAAATCANDLARTGGYSYSLVVPSVKIEGFRFTSGTEF